MDKIRVMINGLPGNMAGEVCRLALSDPGFDVIPYSLTGAEIDQDVVRVEDGSEIALIHPDRRDAFAAGVLASDKPFFAIDYTHPSAVNANALFYAAHQIPFVMGTTGGDREALMQTAAEAKIHAVIAPNMAKQIVGFQAMMEYAAREFPGLFSGYDIAIKESHQKGKADTSGTAKAMVRYFKDLGCRFPDPEIEMVRDPEAQKNDLGVPEAYLGGHAWHTYALTSEDGTVRFSFTHNVNGRQIYIDGTLDAAVFLHRKIADGSRGTVFNMIDILKAGALR